MEVEIHQQHLVANSLRDQLRRVDRNHRGSAAALRRQDAEQLPERLGRSRRAGVFMTLQHVLQVAEIKRRDEELRGAGPHGG